jgi:hypothetical protein
MKFSIEYHFLIDLYLLREAFRANNSDALFIRYLQHADLCFSTLALQFKFPLFQVS